MYLDNVNIPYDAICSNNYVNSSSHSYLLWISTDIITACCLAISQPFLPQGHHYPVEILKRMNKTAMSVMNGKMRCSGTSGRINLGRSSVGWVAHMRRTSCADNHKTVKCVKKNMDTILKDNIDSILNENTFWKKIRKSQNNKSSSRSVDGKTGLEACNLFKIIYNELYNYQRDYVIWQIYTIWMSMILAVSVWKSRSMDSSASWKS